MNEVIWIGGYALILFAFIVWGGRNLPAERWQMLASMPVAKNGDGSWRAVNLTWYGALNALAYVLATATALVLLGAVGVGLGGLLAIVAGVLGLCIPASRLVARLVEGKRNTFSVGGASFVGIITAPWIAVLVGLWSPEIAVLPVLAALSISYAVGEGVGRMACLSFGCCYGRPVAALPQPWKRFFSAWNIVFEGATKKAAYAHQLTGQPLVPVQLMTAYLYCGAAVVGLVLFFRGSFGMALILPLVVTQVWRVLSEFLRADYRGDQKISAYQIMAGLGVVYGAALPVLFAAPALSPDLGQGLSALWTAPVLLVLQTVAVLAFLYTGRSTVTDSVVRFAVREQEI